jgi:hypothetical protein
MDRAVKPTTSMSEERGNFTKPAGLLLVTCNEVDMNSDEERER